MSYHQEIVRATFYWRTIYWPMPAVNSNGAYKLANKDKLQVIIRQTNFFCIIAETFVVILGNFWKKN